MVRFLLCAYLSSYSDYGWKSGKGLYLSSPTMNGIKYFYLLLLFLGMGASLQAQLGPYPTASNARFIGGDTVQICMGDTITFSSTATPANIPLLFVDSFYWDLNGAILLNPGSVSGFVTSAWTGPGVYPLVSSVRRSIAGVIGLSTSPPDTLWLLIVDYPRVLPARDTSVCRGSGIALELTGAVSTDSIVWLPDPTLSIGRADSVWVTPIVSTIYKAKANTVVSYNGQADGFCEVYFNTTVSVWPTPIVRAVSDTAVCIGDTAYLDISPPLPPFPVNPLTYQWSTDRNFSNIIANSARHMVTNVSVNAWYYVQLTDGNGCVGVDSMWVDLRPRPQTPFASVVNDSVCLSEVIALRSTNTSASSFWRGPFGLIRLTGQANIPAITPQQTGFYTLTTQDVFGCPSFSDSVYVTVLPKDTAPQIFGDVTVCAGEDLKLCGVPVAGSTLYWRAPNGDTLRQDTLIIAPNSSYYLNGIWTLWSRNSIGCESNSSDTLVRIHPRPVLATALSDTMICTGDSLQLPLVNLATYRWLTRGSVLVAQNQSITLQNLTRDTILFLEVTNAQGCVYLLDSFRIRVFGQSPAPMIYVDSLACPGERDVVFSTDPALGYYWRRNGQALSYQDSFILDTVRRQDSGLYVLSIQDNNGCFSDSTSVFFRVNLRPNVPVVDTAVTVCVGDPVFLNGDTTITGVNAYWDGPMGLQLSGFNVVLPPDSSYYNNGTWRLIVRDSLTTCRRRSLDVQVLIQNRPSINVSNSGPVCSGQTATVTASDSSLLGSPLSYVWYRDSFLTDTLGTGATLFINNIQGDSTFYAVASNGGSCLSRVKSTTITLGTIPPSPTVDSLITVCEGQRIQFSTSNFGATYQWTGPNNYSSSLRSSRIDSAQLNQAGIYSLVITYLNICPSEPAFVTVTVNAMPAPPIAIVPFYLCANDTLFLRADSSSQCGQLNWIGANTATFPLSGNQVTIPPGDTNHQSAFWRVECRDPVTGCVSRSSVAPLIVYPIAPVPTVAPVADICAGDLVTLQVTSALNTGDVLNWYADSALTQFVDSGDVLSVGPLTSSTTYYLVLTNFGGCASAAVPVPITVLPTAPAPFIITDTNYCENTAILLSTMASSRRYDWTSTTGWSSTDSAALVTVQANNSHVGTYFLRVEDSSGCWSPTASINITVSSNPMPPLAYSNSPICAGEPLVLSTNANCGRLQWYGPLGASKDTVLSNEPAYLNGRQWYVECIDTNTGCFSSSNRIVVAINPTPTIDSLNLLLPTCVGDSLVAVAFASTAVAGNPIQYSWYQDSTRTTLLSPQRTLRIGNIVQDFPLFLVVTDTLTGCEQVLTIPVEVNPLLAVPTILGNLTYCEGDSLLLTTISSASQYYWTGPNGWGSNSPLTQRFLTVLDSGTYYLSIADSSGCLSPPASALVVVHPLPGSFTVFNGGGVCVGQDATFGITGGSAGSTYNWYQLPAGNYVGMGNPFTLSNVTASDSTYYYAIATLNTCTLFSDSILLPVYSTTTIAEAGPDQLLCGIDSTNLQATLPTSTTGLWTSNSLVAIQQTTSPNTLVGPLPIGLHEFYWTLSNSSCANFSVDTIVIEVLPAASEQANAGLDQRYCGDSLINLGATAPQIGTGYWTQTTSQNNAGVLIVDSLDPATLVINLQQGQQYSFVWQLQNGRCGIYSADSVLITIDSIPSILAVAGGDQSSCLGDSVMVQALAVSSGQTGVWTSLDGGILLSPNQANSAVSNLPIGQHQFVWTLSTAGCPAYSSDTTTLTILWPEPIAEADYFVLSSNSSTINVLGNDQVTNSWTITIQQTIGQGQVTNLNTGEFTVTLPTTSQQQQFIYKLCDAVCVNSCDTAVVLLSVEQLVDCPIPNIFTPNNDGVNDQFEIPCVSEDRPAYLAVYNRWGDEVYKSDRYLNQWDGTHVGAALPDGTYFYMVQLTNGEQLQGSVEIRR